ncbi:MAG: phosphoglycerate mutase, partial [Clostridia bacterium]|nr:phosphoglycerate mutase [Clostridia bacterium]
FKNGCDLVYVHVEAPDECGHRGEADVKVASVEKIDELILAPVLKYLETSGEDFRILVLPDHPTPVAIRTHSSDPVPFFLYDPAKITDGVSSYSEAECAKKDYFIPDGSTLLSHMIEK